MVFYPRVNDIGYPESESKGFSASENNLCFGWFFVSAHFLAGFKEVLPDCPQQMPQCLPILPNPQSIAQRNARTPPNSDKFSRFDAGGKDRLVIHELSRLDQVKDQTTN